MPYFSYNTMLTVYELLGWWRRSSELRRVNFAEEWNEYHHLLIMESSEATGDGGIGFWRNTRRWCITSMSCSRSGSSPALAYNFSELIEAHAVDTYGQFADQNKELLRKLPAPRIAKAYYESEDLYLFDEFQTASPRSSRRPTVKTLYDVFEAIRDDEGEHVATMRECQMEDSMIEDVAKVNLGTAAVLALVAANVWMNRAAESVGLDSMESTGETWGRCSARTAPSESSPGSSPCSLSFDGGQAMNGTERWRISRERQRAFETTRIDRIRIAASPRVGSICRWVRLLFRGR